MSAALPGLSGFCGLSVCVCLFAGARPGWGGGWWPPEGLAICFGANGVSPDVLLLARARALFEILANGRSLCRARSAYLEMHMKLTVMYFYLMNRTVTLP